MKVLALTSPHMRGKDVLQAQNRLSKNVFGTDFMQRGIIDGDFGPETARACFRAQYWLGYNKSGKAYGESLDKYLAGQAKPTAEMRTTRNRRLAIVAAAAKKGTLGTKALAAAKKDIGTKESPPNTNRIKFSERWGIIGPWCNMFLSEKYLEVGSKSFKLGVNFAYVPTFLAYAEHGWTNLTIVRWQAVKPGDAVCFDWDRDGTPDHVGFFDEWIREGIDFKTVEGNTSLGNNSNGGEVMERERSINQVAVYNHLPAFVHVGR